MESKFKIGDVVVIDNSGEKYEIMGTRETPYHHTDTGDIYPDNGCDFVTMKVHEGELLPFTHVINHRLKLAEE